MCHQVGLVWDQCFYQRNLKWEDRLHSLIIEENEIASTTDVFTMFLTHWPPDILISETMKIHWGNKVAALTKVFILA